ncbi:hypothetical protein M0P98_00845 [bacterium]|nr:hypothetical protein [bacterium]
MIDNILKYLKVFYKGVLGISIELVYPLITFSVAATISFIIYLIISIKK